MNHELAFKAHTPADAEKWWNVIREASGPGNMTGEMPTSATSSPVESRNVSGQQYPPPQYQDKGHVAPVQTQGLPQAQQVGQGSAGGMSQHTHNTPMSAKPGGDGAPTGNSGVARAPGQY